MSYPQEYSNPIDDYYLSIDQPNKRHSNVFLNETDIKGVKRTFEKVPKIHKEAGKKLTFVHLKSDVCFLTDVFENFIRVSIEEHEIFLSFFVSLHGFTSQCFLKNTGIKLQNRKIKIYFWNQKYEVVYWE